MRTSLTLAAMVAMGLAACDQGVSRREYDELALEIREDLFTEDGREAVRKGREFAIRPPDRALRDSATALAGELGGLYDELIEARRQIVAAPERPMFAQSQLTWAELQKQSWPDVQALLEGATIDSVARGVSLALDRKGEVQESLETARETLATIREEAEANRERQSSPPDTEPAAEPVPESEPVASATPAQPEAPEVATEAAETEAETAPAPPPPPEPDPQAVRDSASAEIDALEALYDELIGILEAIHEAQTDRELTRRAGDAVTLAGFDKRRGVESFRKDVAAEPMWRVTGARRGVERTKARVEREIATASATLKALRGGQSPAL